MPEEKRPEGIGGWLLLAALGLFFFPIQTGYLVYSSYTKLFFNGVWELLTTPANEVYSRFWAPIVIGELVINSGLILVWSAAIFLFFSKKKLFIKWFISTALFSLAFVVVDMVAIKLAHPNAPAFGTHAGMEVMQAVLVVVIWIPYILGSERVKATFIN